MARRSRARLPARDPPRPERLGGGERIAAGAIAAAGVLLLHDPFTSWLRQFAGGLSEPLLVALVLGTVDRHLARRPGQALALGAAAALLRPEAWPFLTLYLAWLWRERALRRGVLAAVTLAVPALWAVPDLLGSGDALTGASRARSSTGAPLSEALEAAGRSLDLAVWGLWAGAAYAFYSARRRDDAAIVTLALAAAAWIAIVAVMAAFGYAGLPRFAAPAAAIGCILGAVGIIELAGEVRRARSLAGRLRSVGLGLPIWGRRYRRAVAGAVAVGAIGLALGVQGAIRIADAPRTLEQASAFGDEVDSLSALVEETGRERLGACDAIETTDLYTQTALAWELERPLDRVGLRFDSLPASGVVLVGAGASGRAAELARARGETIARNREWTAYAVSCASASGSRIAGVAGARR